MDKETLSNYGWIVICVMVLAVMIALATPFGSFVSEAVQSTTQGLFDVNQSALNSTGLINIGDNSFADGGNNGAGETPGVPDEPETPIEPTPCTHVNTTTINANSATCTVAGYTGDVYCNDCKTTIATGTPKPATGHQNTTTINASSTYTGDTYCNDCKTTIATGETISQYQLSGIWKFDKNIISVPDSPIEQDINFISNETICYRIEVSYSGQVIYRTTSETPSGIADYLVYYDREYVSGYDLKILDFGTESQAVSKEFYEWFTANATQQ